MVTVNIQDATTVTTPGGSITGPTWFRASEFTLSSTTRTDGVWQVTSSGAIETMQLQPEHYLAMPYAVSFFFLLGLACGWFKSRLVALALPLFFACTVQAADVFRHHEVVTNTQNDSRSYRVSMFDQDITPGTTISYMAEFVQTPTSATNVGHSGSGTMRIAIQPYNNANVAVGALIEFGVVSYINSGSPSFSGYNFTWPYTVLPTGATKYQQRWKRESPFFQASYNNLGGIVTAPTTTTGDVITRGALISQWPFELAANASITLELIHPTPFLVVIEELKQFATPDGGYNFAYEQIGGDIPSTEHVAPTPDPDYAITPGAPEYEPPEAPDVPNTTPPHAVADTTQKADENAAARDGDLKTLLGQIRDAGAENVNTTTAGLAALKASLDGTGPPGSAGDQAATDDADFEAAKTEAESSVAELTDALGDLQATLLGMLGSYDVTITGSDYPSIGIQLPSQLGGDFVAFDLETYAWLWNIIRFALLCGIDWYALNDAIQTVREALA